MVHKLLVVLGVVAIGMGTCACASTTVAQHTPHTKTCAASFGSLHAASTGDDNEQLVKAALHDGDAQCSVHYLSTMHSGLSIVTISGDVTRSLGTQTVTIYYKKIKTSLVVDLIGHRAYFRGSATAIEAMVGLTLRQSVAAAGRWISVVPTDSVYKTTAAGLTVSSVVSQFAPSSPITDRSAATLGGRRAVKLSGPYTGDGIRASQHALEFLELARGANSLPIRFTSLVPASSETSRYEETIVASKWGESVDVTPPLHSVPLSTILRSTSTTQPVTL